MDKETVFSLHCPFYSEEFHLLNITKETVAPSWC